MAKLNSLCAAEQPVELLCEVLSQHTLEYSGLPMSPPNIFDICRPRAEVLAGTIGDGEFMADLSRVVNGTARANYLEPAAQRDLFEEFDPYAVRAEDALEAARREVKQWRMEQLPTVKRQHHLDTLTEWYVLARDGFRAPHFPADEGLKLARAVGLDFDEDLKKRVCEVEGDDVILRDSITRHRNGSLEHVSEECMLDTLQWAAKLAREQNTGAARNLIEEAHLIGGPTLLTSIEALLNVLPTGAALAGHKKPDAHLASAANDFEALERLRKLSFAATVPAPKIPEQLPLALGQGDQADEEAE